MTPDQIKEAAIEAGTKAAWNTHPHYFYEDRVPTTETDRAYKKVIVPMPWDSDDDAIVRTGIQIWRERIRAAIEAYEAAMWRPISEAPRDGTAVFVYVPALEGNMRYTCVSQYYEGEPSWRNDDFRDATLFQPLPQPPSEVR